jgi:hypothetical protein
MSAIFLDLQNHDNPDSGQTVTDGASAKMLLNKNISRDPFTCQFIFSGQTELLIGLSPKLCFAQHSSTSGDPPYLVAYLGSDRSLTGLQEFLIDDTPTEIRRNQCIPLELLLEVAAYFVETGERSPLVLWEDA